MTHQEAIIRCIVAILEQDDEVVEAFCRLDPFDKLLRSYDGLNAKGERLYKSGRARKHYKMSVKAYQSGLKVSELYGEHKIPLSIIKKRLLDSDRSYQTVSRILGENEVILITKEEARMIDGAISNNGLGFRSSMPDNNRCRLDIAQIAIAPETASNKL